MTLPEMRATSDSRKLVVEKLQHVPVWHWSFTSVAVKSANVLNWYTGASSDWARAEPEKVTAHNATATREKKEVCMGTI